MINDNKMTYHMDSHRYVLNREYVENYMNARLSDVLNSEFALKEDAEPEVFLERVSNLLYSYVYNYANSGDDMEYYLSLYDESIPRTVKNRECICEAMLELAYSIIQNNMERGVYYPSEDSDQDFKVLLSANVKAILVRGGILTRSKLTGLPYDYFSLRGKEY